MANPGIEDGIAKLREWSRDDLIAEWERLYGKDAPRRISHSLLVHAIAWKQQEKIYGGLSRTDQKLLDRLAGTFVQDIAMLKPAFRLKTGTRLRRIWEGKMHEITAVQDGFVHEGIKYPSFSRIARVITGTRWNGLVFSDLKRQATRGDDVETKT